MLYYFLILQAQNAEFFRQYVTEDFNTYIKRKSNENCHGNNIEIQALAEIFNRPIEVYQYSTGNWLNLVFTFSHTLA